MPRVLGSFPEVSRCGRFAWSLGCVQILPTRWCVTIFLREVCSVVLFKVRPCLNPSLRGRPRTVGSVRARAQVRPTPIKSLRSSCGTRSRSIIRNTPGREGRVKGTHRAGSQAAGIRTPRRRINTVTRVDASSCGLACYTSATWAEDRATVGTDPSAAPGLEEE